VTLSTPARLLRLLSLLQGRREWAGTELAERLGVTDRTVRRDVGRLRELGYPVEGTTGTAGGYRLTSGEDLPPLLLDDDEAVAIATSLLGALGDGETASRALAKLTQVMPGRLRRQVAAVGASVVSVPDHRAARIDPGVLAVLAGAVRDREIVRFAYRRRDGTATDRRVEPHHVVATHGLWYLIAFDTRATDWRTFRVDRIDGPESVRLRFTPRELPAADPAEHVRQTITSTPYRYTVRATVPAPVEDVRARLPMSLPARIQPIDETSCSVALGADSLDRLVRDVVTLGPGAQVEASPEVLGHLRDVGRWLVDQSGLDAQR
jgi:predicted DNA-binding transcriptional regulator YafY